MTHEERVKALVGAVDYLQEVYAERERRYWTRMSIIMGIAAALYVAVAVWFAVTLPYSNKGFGKSKIGAYEAFDLVKRIFTGLRAKWIGSGSSARAVDMQYAFRDERVARETGKFISNALKLKGRRHEVDIYKDED